MRGVLNRLIPYRSKHGGRAYKGIVIATDENDTLQEWSIQIYEQMKNYESNNWKQLVETKLNNPHRSIDVDNLAVFDRDKRQLDCDRKVHIGELYPMIRQDDIDKVNGVQVEKKQTKSTNNNFSALFDHDHS